MSFIFSANFPSNLRGYPRDRRDRPTSFWWDVFIRRILNRRCNQVEVFLYLASIRMTTVLHIKVRLPVLLCAVKTVEGDFRFCWTISPNVGQTHKENPNLVRIFYMISTLNDIYKQYNKLHEHWYTKISSLRCVEDRNPPQNASDLYMKYWSYAEHCRPCTCLSGELIKKDCSYRIFIVCRSPVSPVFWARILLSYFGLSLPKQSLCTNFAITR